MLRNKIKPRKTQKPNSKSSCWWWFHCSYKLTCHWYHVSPRMTLKPTQLVHHLVALCLVCVASVLCLSRNTAKSGFVSTTVPTKWKMYGCGVSRIDRPNRRPSITGNLSAAPPQYSLFPVLRELGLRTWCCEALSCLCEGGFSRALCFFSTETFIRTLTGLCYSVLGALIWTKLIHPLKVVICGQFVAQFLCNFQFCS